MKQKLLSVAVASALGLGAADIGQAQESEGVKGYVRFDVVDVRLVNPLTNNLVTELAAASGRGSTNALITVDNIGDVRFATPGSWVTFPFFNDPDAEQACINGEGADYQTDGPPVPGDPSTSYPCPQIVFPGGNDFDQVGDDVTVNGPFEDFSRSDALVVPGTDVAEGQPDVDIDGDDFTLVAACQRSAPVGFLGAKFGAGDTVNQVFARRFTMAAGETPTQFLELRGDYSGRAEAIASADLTLGAASGISAFDVRIERESDEARIGCNTGAVEVFARVLATSEDDEELVPPDVTVSCDAANFPDGDQQFLPGEEYVISASIAGQANCTLAREDGDGFKWYFAKNNRSPRLPRPIVTDLVVNDQFGTQTVNVRQLTGLMNPANKNEAGLPDFTDHLSCYLLGRTSPVPVIPGEVRITTENFGEEDVALRRGPVLCGPAIKTDEDGNSQGSLTGTYYQCYQATGGQPQGAITVSDQFFDEKPHTLTGMSRVCAPVTFGAGTPPPPSDPEAFDHLACYEFPGGSQALNPRIGVEVLDPFMVGAGFGAPGVPVTVEREQRFCEIATKVRLPLP